MFKNASIFRIASGFMLPAAEDLEQALQASAFIPCAPTQPVSGGWVAPRGNKSTVLAEPLASGVILRLCIERRPLPASAVKEATDKLIEKYKEETGRERVSSKIKKEFKDEAIQSLLPRAFTRRSSTTLWIDAQNKFLVVDTASQSGADEVVTELIRTLGECGSFASTGLGAKPVQTQMNPGTAMAHWLKTHDAPHQFTIDRDCELKAPNDQKSSVRYAHHTLEIEEVSGHIEAGKVPTKLAMTWNERVSFTLTDAGLLRNIKLLDVVLDGKDKAGQDDDGFDADAAIVTGELAGLIPDLIEALGGELALEAA